MAEGERREKRGGLRKRKTKKPRKEKKGEERKCQVRKWRYRMPRKKELSVVDKASRRTYAVIHALRSESAASWLVGSIVWPIAYHSPHIVSTLLFQQTIKVKMWTYLLQRHVNNKLLARNSLKRKCWLLNKLCVEKIKCWYKTFDTS